MLETFIATLNPMLVLFVCIAVGFVLRATKILPENASKTIAKLETWVFSPALSFSTMATYCTVESLGTHAVNILFSCFVIAFSMAMAIPLAKRFIKNPSPERGIYEYALTFANFGYMADPIVLALFGGEGLAYYKLFSLPGSIMVYTWGISVLVPKGTDRGSFLKKITNAPTIAMLLGIIVGLSGLGAYLPEFVSSSLNSLKGCMGPLAMILAGVTVANYSMKKMLKNKKIYTATALRLVILPAIIVGVVFGVKELINLIFTTDINNMVVYLAFFFTAMPLGLNTVVFPEAYGGSPETGAGMALISHTLCVLTIPVMFTLMTVCFGACPL